MTEVALVPYLLVMAMKEVIIPNIINNVFQA